MRKELSENEREHIEELLSGIPQWEREYIETFIDEYDNYDGEYFGDIIWEIADNNVDIYNAKLLAWAGDNLDACDEALKEWGDSCDSFINLIQRAQYDDFCNAIYKHDEAVKEILTTYGYKVNDN